MQTKLCISIKASKLRHLLQQRKKAILSLIITTTFVPIDRCHRETEYLDAFLNNYGNIYLAEGPMILCGGKTEVKGSKEINGDASAEVKVKASTETKNGGTVTVEVKGEVAKDKEGNTSGRATGTITWEW